MRVIRSTGNCKLMIQIDTEAERQLVDRVFARGLNTLENIPPALLKVHEEIKRPLNVVEKDSAYQQMFPARAE